MYANVLYDPAATGTAAALPFFVSLATEVVGTALLFSALWPELPTWQLVSRRKPEVIVDEDVFQREWEKRAKREVQRGTSTARGGPVHEVAVQSSEWELQARPSRPHLGDPHI